MWVYQQLVMQPDVANVHVWWHQVYRMRGYYNYYNKKIQILGDRLAAAMRSNEPQDDIDQLQLKFHEAPSMQAP